MHNLDRVLSQQETYNEVAQSAGAFGVGNEFAPEVFNEFSNEFTGEFANEFAGEYGAGGAGETWEAELAAELLTVSNEADMEQFLGKLFSTVAKGVSGFARSNVGRALGGVLKQAAKTALPSLGAALGSAIPIPGVGTAIGSMAGKALANALEAEAGFVNSEDREYEVAQQVVRMARTATQQAMSAPAGANPTQVAAQAVKSAMNATTGAGRPQSGVRRMSGRWVRRGNAILILGV